MLLNISDKQFREIIKDEKLYLPIRWDGKDFEDKLNDLFHLYIQKIRFLVKKDEMLSNGVYLSKGYNEIKLICNLLIESIHAYHNGFPAQAYGFLGEVMNLLMKRPLNIYQKSGTLGLKMKDYLFLYRLRKVKDNALHDRKDLFHVPAGCRSNISTCRYSIAGYPSLYLTTSVKLGKEELGTSKNVIVSRYQLIRSQRQINIRVLELAIKPQDFYPDEQQEQGNAVKKREFDMPYLMLYETRSNYLRWYPLIAACSFIRANRDAPFASEYIIPQLLMQWVRNQLNSDDLMGIRYFSCASARASDMGFDYVFPVNNTDYEGNYCTVLRDAFGLTVPVRINEFENIGQCEEYLKNVSSSAFKKI